MCIEECSPLRSWVVLAKHYALDRQCFVDKAVSGGERAGFDFYA
jgi:hypothetical protein